MIFEKPVVASNCTPIERIINETGAGLTYNSNDENDLASKVIMLYNDPQLRNELGLKGKEAALEKYNWDKAALNLIDVYKKLK